MKLTALFFLTLLLVGCDKDMEKPAVADKQVEVASDSQTTLNGRNVGTTFDFTTRKMGEPV